MKLGLFPRAPEFPLLHLTALGLAIVATACSSGTTSVSEEKKKSSEDAELVQEEESEGTGGSISKPVPDETPDPVCGNGIVEKGEDCDGEDFGGASCDSLGYKEGELGCFADCKFRLQPCVAFAVEGNASELDVPIADDAYDGSIESMTCVDVPLEDEVLSYAGFTDLKVSFGVDHPWAGDLVVKVVSPAGRSATFVHRPGRVALEDNGDLEGGSVATLSADYPLSVSYVAPGAYSAEAIGSGLSVGKIACKDDARCDFLAEAGPAENTMREEPVDGNWKVCFGDAAPGDAGKVRSVGLKISPRAELGAGARFAKGVPLDIPDGTFDGTLESMACVIHDLSQFLGYVTELAAVMGLEHPRPSELVIALVGPEGKPYTLVSRPGVDEDEFGKAASDENQTVWPKGASLSIQNYVSDELRGSSETIGYDGETPLVNACEDKEYCAYSSAKGGLKWPSLPKVLGVKAAGEWKICVGDAAPGNQGKLNSAYIVPSRRTAE